jgi:hypothetical protein
VTAETAVTWLISMCVSAALRAVDIGGCGVGVGRGGGCCGGGNIGSGGGHSSFTHV